MIVSNGASIVDNGTETEGDRTQVGYHGANMKRATNGRTAARRRNPS
jgi:hypothetical protein